MKKDKQKFEVFEPVVISGRLGKIIDYDEKKNWYQVVFTTVKLEWHGEEGIKSVK